MVERSERRSGYLIHGRVQGVGFRWWTRDAATRLGLGGHVRNLPDGAVEIHVVGKEERVAEFEALVRRGPPLARVERVVAIECDERAERGSFLIEQW